MADTDSKGTEVLAAEVLEPQQFIEVPRAVVEEASPSSDPNSEESSGLLGTLQTDARVQGAFAVATVMCQNVSKYNPLQGISSGAQLTTRIRKEFVACADPRQYSKPQTGEEWRVRVRSNLSFFRLSYGATGIFFLIYFLLTSPFLLAELLLVSGLWVYLFQIKGSDEVVSIGSYNLGKKEKLMLMVPLSTFVLIFGGLLSYFFWVGFVSMFFVCGHASFRNQIEANPLDELADQGGNDFV